MTLIFTLAIAVVVIVLLFDYTNGFHDAANIIASVIASRAMTPVQAVVLVAVFEFLGRAAIHVGGFAVGFHVELLHKAREVEQPAGVSGDQVAGATQKVAVPYPQQGHHQRHVVLGGGVPEVLVHGVPTGQKCAEV